MEQNNKPTWKNIYLIVLTIVTIVCIVIGIFNWTSGFSGWFWSEDDYAHTDAMTIVDTEAFDSMDLDLDVGDLEIVAGDSYQIQYDYPKKSEPDIKVENGRLVVTQKQKFKRHLYNNYKMIITVPKDPEMKSLDLDMDMGSAELTDVYAKNLTVEADMGSIEIDNSEFGVIDIAADMGSITLDNVIFSQGSCEADMGSIEMTGASFERVVCTADMGSIDIDGSFEDIEADCSMGSVAITTTEDLDKISFDLSADMGDVTVNGKKQGNKYVR